MNFGNNEMFCDDLPTKPQPEIGKILVTGATGYIGGRLVPELLARGYQVRVMVRKYSPELRKRWPDVEIVVADALEFESLQRALDGIYLAYYLIHSLLLGQKKFESVDIQAAINFRNAAESQNVKRIVYLGGLGNKKAKLSAHLQSRIRVARELGKGKVPTTFFRAAIIIGSGSASYEIIEHLVRNCPIFLVPSWAKTKCQPIAIRDVLKYLIGSLETADTAGKSYDIGGKETLTYEMMLKIQAGVLGKKRVFINSFFSSIKIYTYIASFLTPIPAPITRCLMKSCNFDVVCQDEDIKQIIKFQPIAYKEALLRALSREEQDRVHTRWSDAYPPTHELATKLYELEKPARYSRSNSILTKNSASDILDSICKISCKKGWFHNTILWRTRGWLNRIFLEIDSSRTEKRASGLRVNDIIGFWRVEDLKKNERLLLRSKLKLPAEFWLEFFIDQIDQKKGENLLSIKIHYQTENLFGKIYWYLFLPLHIFNLHSFIKQIEKIESC
ncbi:MAG: hypothetical protein B6244_06280 [Candidatus Cloacimonetes bacterium 4572_55]|nr:MAG: hypothetical protein B6244_06280 [Candidatus Cloacimonetes bacterium 4572_55]